MAQALLPSPIGPLLVESDGTCLVALEILQVQPPSPDVRRPDALLREAEAQLTAYFAGRLKRFDLPLAPSRTPRGEAHRAAIAAIGYGEVLSYGAVAHMLGSSPRAVGQACRRNRLPVIIPCHRVVGAGGAIGHYSGGGGLETKRWLLAHEEQGKGLPDGFID